MGFTTAAGASSLSMVSDAAVYTVGDTITLTITGNSQGEVAPIDQIHVIIQNDPARVTELGGSSQTFTQSAGAAPALVSGFQGLCNYAIGRDNQCLIFDQFVNESGQPVDAGNKTGTFTYTAAASGIATFVFRDVLGADLIFFSQGNEVDTGTAPAGLSVTIVPEPTTAALLGLGLLGLAAWRRARA